MSIVQPTYANMVHVIQQFVSLVEDNSDPLNLFNFDASNNASDTNNYSKQMQSMRRSIGTK